MSNQYTQARYLDNVETQISRVYYKYDRARNSVDTIAGRDSGELKILMASSESVPLTSQIQCS
jgi:hypothetical protein